MAARKEPKVAFKPKGVKAPRQEKHEVRPNKIAAMKSGPKNKDMQAATPKPMKIPKIAAAKMPKRGKRAS